MRGIITRSSAVELTRESGASCHMERKDKARGVIHGLIGENKEKKFLQYVKYT
jgi:hypothetical protein